MILNEWQKEMVKKYKLIDGDIKLFKKPICTIKDGNKVSQEFTDVKHYMCECGQYELFGFIDKFNKVCRDCFKGEYVKKVEEKIIKEEKEIITIEGSIGYKTLEELAEASGKGVATIKRWKQDNKVEKRDGLYYLLDN